MELPEVMVAEEEDEESKNEDNQKMKLIKAVEQLEN